MPSKPTAKNKRLNTTKLELIIAQLNRNDGASLPELIETTGWQSHSIRGFISITLNKRDLNVTSTKQEGKDRRYKLTEAA